MAPICNCRPHQPWWSPQVTSSFPIPTFPHHRRAHRRARLPNAMVSGHVDQPPPPPQLPFHLLEITIISAQELFSSSSRSHPAYAVAWIHPSHKLSTHLDTSGGADPTWNDKFVFRVNDDFLLSDTSAVMIQIYASRRLLPDTLLGTVRVVLSAHHPSSSTRFVALQVRRPSCRPQGILNIGLALLDAYIRRVPIYSELHASAFAYKDLMLGSQSRSSSDLSRALAAEATGGCQDLLLPRSGSVAVGSWVVERERAALQSKLDKWRTELPEIPDREALTTENGERRRRKRRSALCCLCGVREPPWMRTEVKSTIAC